MTQGIEAITTTALAFALDTASLRQRVIAMNIANANTEGFVPLKVSFSSQVTELQKTLNQTGTLDAFALAGARASIEPQLTANGMPAKVQLDVEVANMAENAVHYQALAKGLARHFAIMSAAVSEGRK